MCRLIVLKYFKKSFCIAFICKAHFFLLKFYERRRWDGVKIIQEVINLWTLKCSCHANQSWEEAALHYHQLLFVNKKILFKKSVQSTKLDEKKYIYTNISLPSASKMFSLLWKERNRIFHGLGQNKSHAFPSFVGDYRKQLQNWQYLCQT